MKSKITLALSAAVLSMSGLVLAQAQSHGDLKQNALPLQPSTDPKMPRAAQGWKVEVVAEPPQLKWPSVVEVAPDGRVFVAEDPMDMPGPGNVPADRILCIFPDGHITVFAEHLYAVYGLRYLDGKLYVHHSPKFTVITDNDGIGTDPKDIWDSDCLKPWGAGSLNDHIPSNLRVAMDNYMYLSTGDKGMYHAKSNIDGKMIDLKGGGVARIRPDGTDLEIYSNGSRNHLDLAINDEDEIFTYDNTDDGLGWWTRVTHMVDGGYYGYPYDYRPPESEAAALVEFRKHTDKPYKPYTLWRMDEFGGGAPTGGLSYNEDALPPEYHGNAFWCEWGKGAFERFAFTRDPGTATYKIHERDQMIAGAAIRPLGAAITADGMGFYVTDWQEGGWAKANVKGRLFKLTYVGGPSQATPKPQWYVPAAEGKPFSATLDELIAGLSHPAESVRLVAQRRIAEKGQPAIAPLVALMNDAKAVPHARWHAIWTLDRIDGGIAARAAILYIAKDPKADESVRLQAVRELGTRNAAEATDACVALLSSDSAPLRFRAATALGRIGNPAAVPALLAKLTEKDFFTHYAVFHALHRIGQANPAAWPAIVKGLASNDPAIRAGTQFAIRETFDKGLTDALAAFASDPANSPDARMAATQSLASLHRETPPWNGSWWGTQPERSAPPRKSEEWAGTSVVLGTLQKNLSDSNPTVRRATIDALEIAPDPKIAPVLVEMFGKERDNAVRQSILHALATSKSPEAMTVVTTILKEPKANGDLVPDAIGVAASINNEEARSALIALLDTDSAAKDLVAALEALGKMQAGAAVDAVSKKLKDPDADVASAAAVGLGQIGTEAAVTGLEGAIKDNRAAVAKASVAALGTAQARAAIPTLLEAAKTPTTQTEAITALTRMPDVRAIDAYLDGLSGQDAALRALCRRAIESISEEAWPKVEARLDTGPKLSRPAISELQRIYTKVEAITRWRVAGPFPAAAPEPFAAASITSIDALPADLHGADSKEITWRAQFSRRADGMIDLVTRMDPHEHVYAYAAAELIEKVDRDVDFQMGADDGLILWVNGQKVFEDLKNHSFNAAEFHAAAHLKAGSNLVIAKITQDSGPWAFAVATTTQKKGKLFETDTKSTDPAAYAAYLTNHTGDPAKGSVIFHNATGVGCIKCHAVGTEGGNVGPNLSDVAIKYNRDQIVESVLYPSKQIESGYEQTIIRTKSGDTQAGVVRGETDTEVILYDSAANKIVVRKSDIDRRVLSKQSVMPDGLQASLTNEQFADLIAYLTSLKEAPKK